MNPICRYKETHGAVTVTCELFADEYPEPRDHDYLGTLVCWSHRDKRPERPAPYSIVITEGATSAWYTPSEYDVKEHVIRIMRRDECDHTTAQRTAASELRQDGNMLAGWTHTYAYVRVTATVRGVELGSDVLGGLLVPYGGEEQWLRETVETHGTIGEVLAQLPTAARDRLIEAREIVSAIEG